MPLQQLTCTPVCLCLQTMIAAGHGSKRPKPKKEAQAKMGTEGEDVVEEAEGGALKLKLPSRLAPGGGLRRV